MHSDSCGGTRTVDRTVQHPALRPRIAVQCVRREPGADPPSHTVGLARAGLAPRTLSARAEPCRAQCMLEAERSCAPPRGRSVSASSTAATRSASDTLSPRAICVTVVHVDTLLGDATLRAGAQRVAAEIAAIPGPDSAVHTCRRSPIRWRQSHNRPRAANTQHPLQRRDPRLTRSSCNAALRRCRGNV
jgi:hypothetical protein